VPVALLHGRRMRRLDWKTLVESSSGAMALKVGRRHFWIVVILIIGSAWALVFTGFCFERLGRLSDDEFKRIAVRAEAYRIAGFAG
jgi:hypothetical protein